MATVFVSYSRKDIDFARRLTDELKKSDLDFWIDWEGIPPTVDWWKEIEKGIEEADAFIFLLSPDSVTSEVCGQEIDCAVKNGKRLIPLVVRNVDGEVTPPHLSHLNWIFFRESDNFGTSIKKLLTAIHTDYEWVQQHRWLQVRALDWERGERDKGSLLRGNDLQEAEFQLAANSSKEPHPTDLQREYVFESRKVADRQRTITLSISIAGVIALAALAVWGWGQAGLATSNAIKSGKNEATAQAASTLAISNLQAANTAQVEAENQKAIAVANEQEAIRQAQIALDRQWAAEANAILANPNGNTETAALLSLQALKDGYIPSANAALVESLNRLYTRKLFDQHQEVVRKVAYSPKGERVLIGYGDGTADLYDLNSNEILKHFEGLDTYPGLGGNDEYSGVLAADFSSTGTYLLVAGSGGDVRIWDEVTGSVTGLDFKENLVVARDMLWSAKFSPDEKYILIGTGYPHGGPGNIYLFDRETGQLIYAFPQSHSRFISDLEFSRDGNLVLSTSYDGTAMLWDLDWAPLKATPRETITMPAQIRDGALSNDNSLILLGGDNGTVALYKADGQLVKQFTGHTTTVYSVAFTPSENYILTAGWDHTARLWDVQTGQTVRTFANHLDKIWTAALSPDGKYLLTGSNDKTARLWNADSTHETRTIRGHSGRVLSLAFLPDGESLLSTSVDGSIRLWDMNTLEEKELDSSKELLSPVAAISAQGRWIAARSSDNQLVIWELSNGKYKQTTIIDTPDLVRSLTFAPSIDGSESQYLLLGMTNSCLSALLKVGAGWDVFAIYFANCLNNGVAFTPDGKYVAIAAVANLPIYKIDETLVADCMKGSTTLAFSKDGKYLASQSGNDIVIWEWQNLSECNPVKRLSGHTATVSTVKFSPDGKYLLSASLDGTAKLWDTASWTLLRTLTGHEGDVVPIAFSPDGKLIATGGGDQTIRIWRTDYQDTVHEACALLLRSFTPEERTLYEIKDSLPTCGD